MWSRAVQLTVGALIVAFCAGSAGALCARWDCVMVNPPYCFFCDSGNGFWNKCTVTCSVCTVTNPCPPGEFDCFLAGTSVATPTGVAAIENLKVGDEVLSQDEGGRITVSRVTKTIRVVHHRGYLVINGRLRVSHLHRLMASKEVVGASAAAIGENPWVEARSLEVGDELRTLDGKGVRVESIEFVNKGVRVYDLEASGGNFFANGILVQSVQGR